MIKSFRHRGLERLFLEGNRSRIPAAHESRIRLILARLNASKSPQDMNLPGLYLHQLKGDKKGTWSVRVTGNWRVTFKFEGADATNVELEDYH